MDERDFIKEYKDLFDGIEARKELKDKILRQKPRRNKIRPIVATIATTAAAVLIFIAVHDYNFDHDDSGIISTVTVSETEPPEQKDQTGQTPDFAAEDTEPETGDIRPTQKPADNKNSKTSSKPKSSATPAPSRITPQPHTVPQRNTGNAAAREAAPAPGSVRATPAPGAVRTTPAPKVPAPTLAAEAPAATEKVSESGTAEKTSDSGTASSMSESAPDTAYDKNDSGGSLVLPFRTGTVTLRMAAESVLTDIILQSMQQNEESDSTEEYHTERWDNIKYFDYLGNNILNNISISSDMVYSGEEYGYFTISSDGKLKDDHRIFVFNGSGSRKASILTSRDTSFVDAVLSSPEIDKKTIKDIEMTAFGSDAAHFFYIKSNDIAYIVTTEGLNGEEIAELISSIN